MITTETGAQNERPDLGKRTITAFSEAVSRLLRRLAIRLFVNGVWLHRFWGCHRLPDRCFFIEGRQFHVCSRCTGLIVGLPCSLLLLPVRGALPPVFGAIALVLALDGLTQLAGWRLSNNALRFATGFGAAVTFLPSLVTACGYL